MGQRLAKLLLLTTSLGGCSLLYDPSDLPPAADAPPPPPDLMPCLLEVTELAPATLVEGTGVGGSRPALLVVRGKNLIQPNTSVKIVAAAGSTRTPDVEIDPARLEVGAYGEQLAVPIALPVDDTLPQGAMVALDVTVEQDCPEGRVARTIAGKLALKGLDELRDGAMATIALDGTHEYSEINVQAATIAAGANRSAPLILRSMSSARIAKDVSVSADPMPSDAAKRSLGGPGAGNGGLGGDGLAGSGEPGTGPYPGLTPGAAGRFESPDVGLATLNGQNRGSGGAGGNAAVLAGRGGRGGGGGGSIEIFAGGDLQVARISARGTPGESGAGLGGADGGGGSGGVILLRAGGTLAAGDLDVGGGGTGQVGRARYDAGGAATVPSGPLGDGHYRGPMFVDPPLTTRSKAPELTVAGRPLSPFRYVVITGSGAASLPIDETIGDGGTVRITLGQDLEPGSNQVCLLVAGANATSDTRNCIHLAYLR